MIVILDISSECVPLSCCVAVAFLWEANWISSELKEEKLHPTKNPQDFYFSEKMKNELTASFANPRLTVTSENEFSDL